MAISSDYPKPITVNGYVCRNCDDVSKAKKFEDPAGQKITEPKVANDVAVSFGGTLEARSSVSETAETRPPRQALDRYA
jgi:hypothetical protein